MADRYLLESSQADGYLLEDGSGVLVVEGVAVSDVVAGETGTVTELGLSTVSSGAGESAAASASANVLAGALGFDVGTTQETALGQGQGQAADSGTVDEQIGITLQYNQYTEVISCTEAWAVETGHAPTEAVSCTETAIAELLGQGSDAVATEDVTVMESAVGSVAVEATEQSAAVDTLFAPNPLPTSVMRIDIVASRPLNGG